MKYYEVVITTTKVYTVQAENGDAAIDIACDSFGEDIVDAWANELLGEEDIDRSKRHACGVIEM